MRLDATDLRYITNDEFKVLTAVEVGSKNHEVVPSSLITELSGIRGGNVNKALSELRKRNLVARVQNAKYNGFRLTYGGLDYLALKTFSRRKPPSVAGVGKRIGVGKESDIHVVVGEAGDQRVLKMHRLGRISFRAVKSKRDYLGHRTHASWMHMSKLAAQKEFAFMKALHQHGFPVPVPLDQVRHCIVMSLIDSYPLRQIEAVDSPGDLYAKLMELIVRLAGVGLIHGDFNEFNILIRRKDGEPVVIDFPQMTSTRHQNAEYFFNRDVNCIRKFFRKRFRYEGQTWPTWKDVMEQEEQLEREASTSLSASASGSGSASVSGGKEDRDGENQAESSTTAQKRVRIDLEVEASGFGRAMQRELEDYMVEVQDMPDSDNAEEVEDDEDDEEDEEEVEDGEKAEQEDAERRGDVDQDEEEKRIAEQLEAMRLNPALGNDPSYQPDNDDASQSDSYSESESEAESIEPQPTEFSTARPRQKRFDAKHLHRGGERGNNGEGEGDEGLKDAVSQQIHKEKGREKRKHHARKAPGKLGNQKGHKWKSSPGYLVGKSEGW